MVKKFTVCDDIYNIVYILENKEYIVGRKDADVHIRDDTSISRKHATLKIMNGNVYVKDCGSKYCTFIGGNKLKPNEDTLFEKEKEITFGVFKSTYILCRLRFKIVASSISANEKEELLRNLKIISGEFVNEWSLDCTHLTTKEIKLTVKILCAITNGQPIVTMKYWEDVIKCAKSNEPLPTIKDYAPPITETILHEGVSLGYIPERKTLFANKVFVFPTDASERKMGEVVAIAGGKSMSWESNRPKTSDFDRKAIDYLLIQPLDSTSISKEFTGVVKYLQSIKKRIIPLQEIALALVYCSCEKHCNSKFDRAKNLFTTKKAATESDVVLAPETQSQIFSSAFDASSNTVADSLEVDLPVNTYSIPHISETHPEIFPRPSTSREATVAEALDRTISFQKTPASEDSNVAMLKVENSISEMLCETNKETLSQISLKRESDSLESDKVKRSRIVESENYETSTRSRTKKISENNPFASTNIKSKTSNIKENPFAIMMSKKRKANNDLAAPTKKMSAQDSGKSGNPFTQTAKMEEHILEEEVQPSILKTSPKAFSSTAREGAPTFNSDISCVTNRSLIGSTANKWLSKSNIKKEERKSIYEHSKVDADMESYISAFANSVVIVEVDLVTNVTNSRTYSMYNGKPNFKKFRKVQPLHIQTHIIPKASMVKYVCDGTNKPVTEFEGECEDDMQSTIGISNKQKKKGIVFKF